MLLFVSWEIRANAQLCGGRFTYPLDDAYIHLGMAKNWLRFGVIGANSEAFHPLATSPLYTGIVTAIMWLFGDWEYWMLTLNLLFCTGVLALSHRLLTHRFSLSPFPALLTVWLAAALSPLHILVVGGMEHVAQIFFLLLYLNELLKDEEAHSSGALPLWAFLASATRPECLFVIGPALLLKAFQSRPTDLLFYCFTALLSAAPWLIYGAVNLHYGHYFLPDSLLLKSADELDALHHGSGQYLLFTIGKKMKLLQDHAVLGWLFWALAGALLVSTCRSVNQWNSKSVILGSTVLMAIILHTLFGKFGWLYRYENYLIYLGVLAGGGLLAQAGKTVNQWNSKSVMVGVPLLLIALFLGWKLWWRTADSYRAGTVGGQNIYRHQRFMAEFFRRNYNGRTLLVHDIGLLGWRTDCRFVDVSGLSGGPILRLEREGQLDSASLKPILQERNPVLALLYPHIARPLRSSTWIPVDTLIIRPNVVMSSDTVLVFAFDSKEMIRARTLLRSESIFLKSGSNHSK